MQMSSSSCCSSEQLVIEDDLNTKDHEDSEEDGCCGLNCDCMCCAHVWVKETADHEELIVAVIGQKDQIVYYNNYFMSYQNKVWHPPCKDQ